MGRLTVMRTQHCKYPIPLGYGSAIVSSQLRFCNIGEGTAKDLIIKRRQDDHTRLYLMNHTDKPVIITTKTGEKAPLEPGKSVALQAVKQVRMAGGETITAD